MTGVIVIHGPNLTTCQRVALAMVQEQEALSVPCALVKRHRARPIVNVGNIGFAALDRSMKLFNLIAMETRLSYNITFSDRDYTKLLSAMTEHEVGLLFWLVCDDDPVDCWPPNAESLYTIIHTQSFGWPGQPREAAANALDEIKPQATPLPAFITKPVSLPYADGGKSRWRGPRVSGTQSVSDVAKRAKYGARTRNNKESE
jgi:hypothetical protein